MTLRTRILLSFVLVVGIGFYFLIDYIIEDLRPRYLEAVEESLVDQANVLAGIIEADMVNGEIQTDSLTQAFERLKNRLINAQIYTMLKTHVDERVYVTDDKGIVIFDSAGLDVGKDFSAWNDVHLTLQGRYGVRTTRDNVEDPTSSVLHVAAPITHEGKIIGVITVRKPTVSINQFIQTARPKLMIAGWVTAMGVILLAILFSFYFTRPIHRLTQYARAVRDGKRVALPKLGSREIAEMGKAFEQMRESLEGKKYVEAYVQTLTHELKSPLAAIQGAVEILSGDLAPEKQHQFLNNIAVESKRMHALIERLLELAALESQTDLQVVNEIDMAKLVASVLDRSLALLQTKQLQIHREITPGLMVRGDPLLLEQVLQNLIQNAVDFSPHMGVIEVALRSESEKCCLDVIDEGPGIPDYALGKIFDRFYSLARPETGKKSSGLGLSFVREVAELHGGKISIKNREAKGVTATFMLPMIQK